MSGTPVTDAKSFIAFDTEGRKLVVVLAATSKSFERERNQARALNAKFRNIAERILLNCETLHPNTIKLHRTELDQLKEATK